MTVGDVQDYITTAVGGAMVGDVIDGIARYPISIRYLQNERENPEALRRLPIITPKGQQITLGDVAQVKLMLGPSMLRTEGARPAAWVFVDARDRDMAGVVEDIKAAVAERVPLKPGVSVAYSGQYELMARAAERLKLMAPRRSSSSSRSSTSASGASRSRSSSLRACPSRSWAASGSST